jgi:hypothetical protein
MPSSYADGLIVDDEDEDEVVVGDGTMFVEVEVEVMFAVTFLLGFAFVGALVSLDSFVGGRGDELDDDDGDDDGGPLRLCSPTMMESLLSGVCDDD